MAFAFIPCRKPFSSLKSPEYSPMLSCGTFVASLTIFLIFYIPGVCFTVRSEIEIPFDFSSGQLTLAKFEGIMRKVNRRGKQYSYHNYCYLH